MTSSRRAMTAFVVTLLFGLGAGPVPPEASGQQPHERQQGSKVAPTMVVLDASGSMANKLASGGTRMDAAKHAIGSLLDEVSSEAPLGLTVYGTSTGSSPEEKKAGCRDVRTLHEVGEVDNATLRSTVNGIEPSGYTPIGRSLRHAASKLPAEGPRSILLISDGKDTCAPPPPCRVARELDERGVDLAVHTVGFKVAGDARAQLECVAEETGGSYTHAPDAGSLDESLPEVAKRALRTYEARGTPIEGTPEVANAPRLRPGQYVDSIKPDQPLHYRVSVPKNVTVRIAATQVMPNEGMMGVGGAKVLHTRLLDDPSGDECARAKGANVNQWEGPVTAVLRWSDQKDTSSCEPDDREMIVKVFRSTNMSQAKERKLELMVIFEPPATSDVEPSGSSPSYTAPPQGRVKEVAGGGSFNDATTLPGTGRYSDVIRHGEWISYRVRVGWGQTLAYQVRAEAVPENVGTSSHTRSGPIPPADLETTPHAPDRAPFARGAAATDTYDGNQLDLDPVVTPPVRYNNRKEIAGPPAKGDLAGWHYITVWLTNTQPHPIDNPIDVRIQLNVNVLGDKVAGPEYEKLPGLPSGPATGSGADSTGSSNSSADPRQRSQVQASQDIGFPLWGWLTIAGVTLAAVAVGITLLVLRKRRTSSAPPGWH